MPCPSSPRPHRRQRPAPGRLAACLLALALGASAVPSAAEMPQAFAWQALLEDAAGQPIASSNVTLTFRFHREEAGGAPLHQWVTPSALDLGATGGLVEARIPVAGVLRDALQGPLWVEIVVDDGVSIETLAPRMAVLPVPMALNADRLQGREASEFLTTGSSATVRGDRTFTGGFAVDPGTITNPTAPNVAMADIRGATAGTGPRSVVGLQASATAEDAGASRQSPSLVRGILAEGESDGYAVMGLSATGSYSGRNESDESSAIPSVLGVNAVARFALSGGPGPGARMNAVGASARAAEAQAGPNTGILGAARNSASRNIGVSGVVGATEADAHERARSLPHGFSASLFGHTNATGPDAYGLHIDGRAAVLAADSRMGDGANGAQLRILGEPTGPGAAYPADYELDVVGDAHVAGDLALAEGALRLGADGDGAYIRSERRAPLLLSPGAGEVVVAGRIRQTEPPEGDLDLATVGWVRANMPAASAAPSNPAPAAPAFDGSFDGVMAAEGFEIRGSDGGFRYAQPRERVLSIPASAFAPARASYDFVRDARLLRDSSAEADEGGQRYAAPVFLPDGAVIRSISIEAADNDPDASISFSLASAAAGSAPAIGGVGTTTDRGIQTATLDIPGDDVFRVVDNGAFAYTAVVSFSANGHEGLELYTFRVRYTVEQAD